MNANDLLDTIGDVKCQYIWEAQKHRGGKAAPKRKRLSPRKMLLIAAVIALTLLLVGCAVAYVLRLQRLKIGEDSFTEQAHYGPNWEKIGEKTITSDVISLQGYNDSPSRLATMQWLEFLKNYDGDIPGSFDDVSRLGIPETYYYTYGCYTREMAEKLDEIVEKYNLKLLSPALTVQNDQYQVMFDALKIPGVFRSDASAAMNRGSGYFYPEGTFCYEFSITLTGEDASWPYEIFPSVYYSRKGYFCPITMGIGDIESYRQWDHTLPDGTRALLAMNEEGAMILVDREDAFISVSLDSRWGVERMSEETVEQIADLFDFSIRPQSLDDQELAQVQARLDALNEQALKESRQRQAEYEKSLHKEDYDGWVKQILEESYGPDLGYAFLDIDGNGKEELLIGRDGYGIALYMERDGAVEQIFNAYTYLYPCEDNKFISVMGLGKEADYFLSQWSDGKFEGEARIRYVPGCPDGEYWRYDLADGRTHDYIAKEEFDGILEPYVRIPVKFRPLSEYPLDGDADRKKEVPYVIAEAFDTYESKIRMRLTDREEQWDRWAYALRDLDGNGQEEMIWREDDRYFVYTILDGTVCCYNMLGDTVTVCEDGFVEAVSHYGPVNKTYRYYRIDGGRVTLVDYLRFDTDADPENPWFRSPDLSCQDITMEAVSREAFDAIRARYTPLYPEMKPIREFPLD